MDMTLVRQPTVARIFPNWRGCRVTNTNTYMKYQRLSLTTSAYRTRTIVLFVYSYFMVICLFHNDA